MFEEVLSINPDQCLSSGTHCSHVTCPPVLSPLQDWVPTVDPCQTQRAEKCWCNQHQPTHAVHTGSNAQRIQCSLGVQAFRSLGTRTSADPLCPPPPPPPPPAYSRPAAPVRPPPPCCTLPPNPALLHPPAHPALFACTWHDDDVPLRPHLTHARLHRVVAERVGVVRRQRVRLRRRERRPRNSVVPDHVFVELQHLETHRSHKSLSDWCPLSAEHLMENGAQPLWRFLETTGFWRTSETRSEPLGFNTGFQKQQHRVH